MSKSLAVGIGLVGAAAIGADYFINGPNSIIGKILGQSKGFAHVPGHITGVPSDPLYGEPRFGTPSVGYNIPGWVYPVKTARAPFPALNPDMSGRIKIPVHDGHVGRQEAEEMAAASIANLVFIDASFYSPSEKWNVGTSVEIKHNVLDLIRSPDAPELLLRLVEFHQRHGGDAHNRGSPIYNQEIKLAGACADLYESYLGMEKWFSREGNAYAAEYDEENNRLAAAGAKSPIWFGVQGAYYTQ